MRRPSAMMSSTLPRGFSDEIGSWKIIFMAVRGRRGREIEGECVGPGLTADGEEAPVRVTGDVGVDERRLVGDALRLRVRTTRRELATDRRLDEVGRPARDRVELRVTRHSELR